MTKEELTRSEREAEFTKFCEDNEIYTAEDLLEHIDKQILIYDAYDILNPPKPEGNCIFCNNQTTDRDFCYGCEKYICIECTKGWEQPSGTHHFEDHNRTPETEEEC
jgi:hypothetical protein